MTMNALDDSSRKLSSVTDPLQLFSTIGGGQVSLLELHVPIVSYLHYYLPKMLQYSVIYPMVPSWEMRPDYCSYDIYGTTNLAWLILFINGCPSVSHFSSKYIKDVIAPLETVVYDFIAFVKEGNVKLI